MKKILILIVLIVSSISVVHAQRDRFRNELSVGVGGGAQMSRVDFMPRVLQDNRFGMLGGVAAKYISDQHERGGVMAGVIAELNFTQRGWTETFSDAQLEQGFAYTRALNYLSLPLMTHVNAGRGTLRFLFNAGPQISFLINDNATMSQPLRDHIDGLLADDPNRPVGVQYRSFDNLRRVEYGIVGGAGMQIRTGMGDFDLEGRYYFGLSDVFESRRSRNAHFSRSAHRVIEVKLTYYTRLF